MDQYRKKAKQEQQLYNDNNNDKMEMDHRHDSVTSKSICSRKEPFDGQKHQNILEDNHYYTIIICPSFFLKNLFKQMF